MWDRRIKIEDVHDGDTVTAYIDDGRSEFAREKIRLFGTFAPELTEPGGVETRDFARAWVKARTPAANPPAANPPAANPPAPAPVAWPFHLQYIRNKSNTAEEETFGRYVAMIYTADQTECLNTAVSAFVKQQGFGGGIGTPR